MNEISFNNGTKIVFKNNKNQSRLKPLSGNPTYLGDFMERPDYYSIKLPSNSSLKNFLDYSPKKAFYLYKERIKETQAVIFGRAIHKAVYEKKDFDEEFTVLPEDINLRTKAGREERDALMASGKTILKAEHYELCQNVYRSLWDSPIASKFLRGQREKEYFGEIDGLKIKAKVDIINVSKSFIGDLKTTQDAHPDVFTRECIKRKYFMQGWLYRELASQNGDHVKHFVFTAVEKEPPFSRSVLIMEDEQFEIGKAQALTAIARFKYAEKNQGEDYDKNIERFDLPNWYVNQWLGE